jgi:hypothetical protein
MPRNFLRRVSRQFRRNDTPWYLKPFRALLHQPMYFAVNRRSVTGALWLGVLIAMLPFPGHTPVAVVLALVFGVNLAVAALAVWVNSPLTMLPVFYFEYRLGAWLLGTPLREWPAAPSWDWLWGEVAVIWKPLFLGAGIVAVLSASLVYLGANALWRWSASRRRRERTSLPTRF